MKMTKTIGSLALAGALLLTTPNTEVEATSYNKNVYVDVWEGHQNILDIDYLLSHNILEPSRYLGPKEIVTREEIAVILAKALNIRDVSPVDTKFSDVNANNVNSGYINAMVRLGVIKGYPDGTFKPNQKLTRGHMAEFIARAYDAVLPSKNVSESFTDVWVGHSNVNAIARVASVGIAKGYQDGRFKPSDSLTRAHLIAFIARAHRYEHLGYAITPEAEQPTMADLIASGTYVVPEFATWYKDCITMNKYYSHGVKKGHISYDIKLDSDRDGWACEPGQK